MEQEKIFFDCLMNASRISSSHRKVVVIIIFKVQVLHDSVIRDFQRLPFFEARIVIGKGSISCNHISIAKPSIENGGDFDLNQIEELPED